MASGEGTGVSATFRTFVWQAAVFTLLVSATACQISSEEPARVREGFDFSFSYDETDPSVGPKVGEKIDLTNLKARDGKRLSSIEGHQMMVLATIDPSCVACKIAAADQLRDVQSRIAEFDVPFYLVSFTTSKPRDEFFRYTDSLDIAVPAFLWDMSEQKPPDALYTMVLPSHILVDRNGIVILKWAGTDNRKPIRARMANQIVSDTFGLVSRKRNSNQP